MILHKYNTAMCCGDGTYTAEDINIQTASEGEMKQS